MGRVHIVTDSACHIPAPLSQELDIHIVQMPYVWDGVTYLDETGMGLREFYGRLRASDALPTTSGPTPGSFRQVFEELGRSGDPILVIHVGQEFSSTHTTADLARKELPGAPIHLFDSHSNALGLGFQVLAVARAAREGATIEELLSLAQQARESTGVVFAVDDVSYLHRGGRINFGQRLLASLLHLVPIMAIENGPIRLVESVRSGKRASSRLIEAVVERTRERRPLRIGVLHADNEAEAYELRRAVQSALDPDEVIMQELTPILGIHTGPGAVGLAYSFGL